MPITSSRIPEYPSGGGGSEWTLIQSFSDTNIADITSFDTGVMGTTYDIYRIIGWVKSEIAANININLIINNLSDATYYYVVYPNSGGIVAVNTTTAWRILSIAANTSYQSMFEYYIKGNNITYPCIFGNGFGYPGGLLSGRYVGSALVVDRIKLFTTNNTTAKMNIYGMNF